MSTYIVAFNAGIADVVKAEIQRITPKAEISTFYEMQGWLAVKNVSLSQLLTLHSIEKVIELARAFYFDKTLTDLEHEVAQAELPALNEAASFRVSCRRYGNHPFGSNEVQVVCGRVLQQAYGTPVSLKNYDTHVRVDIMARFAYVGIQHTAEKWGKRYHFSRFHRAGIRPSMAYALLQASGLKAGQTLLDPFTGGGTIPIEAADQFGDQVRILGSDLYDEVIEQATDNARQNDLEAVIHFYQRDIYELDKYDAEPVDCIVSNPPYGVKSATNANMRKLYRGFIIKAANVLKPEGRMVVMVQRSDMFRQLVGRTKLFKMIEERVVESSSLNPHIFVLGKIDDPED